MGKKTRIKASVTVFFIGVFMVLMLFFAVLFFWTEKNIAETQGAQILQVSASAALSEFDRTIEEKFGFYCVDSSAKVEQSVRFYLKENTMVSGAVFMDQLSIKNVQVTPTQTLASKEVIKSQISDFMEIRGLIETTELLIEQFSTVGESAEAAQEELDQYSGMEAYNNAYLEIVEIVEGVRADGSETGEGFAVYEAKIFPVDKEPILTSLSFEMDIKYLMRGQNNLKLALAKLKAAEASILEGEEKDLLPLNAAQITELQTKQAKNYLLLAKMLNAISADKSGAENYQAKLSEAYQNLKKGYQKISVQYEIHEQTTYSLTELKKALFGEAANLKIYAPNEDKVDRDSDLYADLPSKQSAFDFWGDETDLESFSEELSDTMAQMDEALFRAELLLYIQGMFTDLRDTIQIANGEQVYNMREKEYVSGIFNNEVEYLLYGSVNEYQNVQAVKASVLALRTVLNMTTLIRDNDKMSLIKTIAAAAGGTIVPGIGEKVIEIILVSAWSLWEASADWTALVNGKKVALVKPLEEWQTDLDSILGTLSGKSDVPSSTTATKGSVHWSALDYSGYLALSLCLVPTDTLIARIQDLVYLQKGGRNLDELVCAFEASGALQTAGLSFSFKREFVY